MQENKSMTRDCPTARRSLAASCALLGAVTLTFAGVALGATSNAEANKAASQAKNVQLSVLSSPANYVSGGDARIGVRAAPGLHDKIELWLNGSRLAGVQFETQRLAPAGGRHPRPAPGREPARGVREGTVAA